MFQRRSDRFFEHSHGPAVAALRVDENDQLLAAGVDRRRRRRRCRRNRRPTLEQDQAQPRQNHFRPFQPIRLLLYFSSGLE